MTACAVVTITEPIEAQAEQEIAPLFQSYQKAGGDRKQAGEQLGRCLLRWRDEYKAQGSHDGDGFKALLVRLGIPRGSAYRLIRRVDPYFVSSETRHSQCVAPLEKKCAAVLRKIGFKRMSPAYILLTTYFSHEAWEAAYRAARSNPDIAGPEDLAVLDWLWSVLEEQSPTTSNSGLK
jgi:hypothetical protein